MPKSSIPTIKGYAYPIMPDGTKKPSYLLEMEKRGQSLLTVAMQLLVMGFYKDNRPAREPKFRPTKSNETPQNFNFFRPEYRNGMFIAIRGTPVKEKGMCSQCRKPEVGCFKGCTVLGGFGDNCCANCAYAGADAKKSCTFRPGNKVSGSGDPKKRKYSNATLSDHGGDDDSADSDADTISPAQQLSILEGRMKKVVSACEVVTVEIGKLKKKLRKGTRDEE